MRTPPSPPPRPPASDPLPADLVEQSEAPAATFERRETIRRYVAEMFHLQSGTRRAG